MTTDRELLELAAKAAGLEIDARNQAERDALIDPATASLWAVNGSTAWNPLTNDGDEARLEAALRMDVSWLDDRVCVGRLAVAAAPASERYADHGGDKRAARRRAGTRAAAEIARAQTQKERAS